MTLPQNHIDRVKQELLDAGLTARASTRGESKHLPDLIHEDEHIHGAVFGRRDIVTNAMLVATDRKILFIDWSPMFMNTDEVTYEVVSGVSLGHQGLTNTVTLHTRIKDFTLFLVNLKSARKFVDYIEKRRLEGYDKRDNSSSELKQKTTISKPTNKYSLEASQLKFLKNHKLATLATIGYDGKVAAATVYYYMNGEDLYMMTKEETTKARNILRNPEVAIVIADESELATMQLKAKVFVETDIQKRQQAFDYLILGHNHPTPVQLPPIANIDAGAFVALRAEIIDAKFSQFGGKR